MAALAGAGGRRGLLGGAAGLSLAACLADLPPAESADGDGGGTQDSAVDGAANARCGDGIIQRDAGEQCDPGTQDAADTCSADCQAILCPDGGFVRCERALLLPRRR